MLEVVLPEKSYEIIIERNALDHVWSGSKESGKIKKSRLSVIRMFFPIYGEKICQQLRASYEVVHYVVPAGRATNHFDMAAHLYAF